MAFLGDLQRWLDDAVARYDIPGAAVAVGQGAELAEAASGVLNRNTGVPATPDTVFQIGSITKVWTAALVMQLVDEGLFDLDEPVRRYLPGFAVLDAEASRTVTPRQLLSHTGGFVGDLFEDTGMGDDALDRYLEFLSGTADQIHRPGELFSYANSGYCVLGALIAKLRGSTWEQAIRDRLIAPIGADHTALFAHEAIMFRAAVGHTKPENSDKATVFPRWVMPRSNAPAGATMCAAPRDLVRFGRMFLSGGLAEDGTRLLSPDSVAAMRTPQVQVPGPRSRFAVAWGLGFQLFDWNGTQVIGHDGATIGQLSTWRVLPEHDLVVAASMTGEVIAGLFDDVLVPAILETTGVQVPPRPVPPPQPTPVDTAPYTGRYRGAGGDWQVIPEDGGLRITLHPDEQAQALGAITETERYVPYEGHTFIGADSHDGHHYLITFLDNGRYLYTGRAIPKAQP